MPESDTVVAKTPTPASTANMDLSAQITATLDKRAGETVKCVRVFGDNYRCNWWVRADPAASPSARGLSLEGTMMPCSEAVSSPSPRRRTGCKSAA